MNVREKIIQRHNEVFEKAKTKYSFLEECDIEVSFIPRSKIVAGMFFRKNNKFHIKYNDRLANFHQNTDYFLNEVIPHEIAHLIVRIKYDDLHINNLMCPKGEEIQIIKSHWKSHGKEWKKVCKSLGMQTQNAYHKMKYYEEEK